MGPAIALLLVACTEPPPVELDPLDPYGDEDKIPQPDPFIAVPDGDYYVRTQVDVRTSVPTTTLHTYAGAPGATLVSAAEAAQIPAYQLLAAAGLATRLPAWYDEVLQQNGVALLSALGLGVAAEALPSSTMIEGSISIAGSDVHATFDTLYFDAQTLADTQAVDLAVSTPATFAPTSRGGSFDLAPIDLVIPFGAYVYAHKDQANGNSSMRVALGALTACPAVALAVASKCGGACTLLVPALNDLCEQGLDQVFARTRAQVESVTFHIIGGGAAILDHDHDGAADHLDGSWQVSPQTAVLPMTARHVL